MKEDRLFEWWMENRFERFCQYMHSWRSRFPDLTPYEDQAIERVRIDRAISYLDMDDQHKNGGGFIRQYLLIKYCMDFVENITNAYWELEQEADKQDSSYWARRLEIKEVA